MKIFIFRASIRATEAGAKLYFSLKKQVTELAVLGERMTLVAFDKFDVVGR